MTTRKSTLKNFVSGCVVRSERHNDILNGNSIGKEHLPPSSLSHLPKRLFFFGFNKEVRKEPSRWSIKKLFVKVFKYSQKNTCVEDIRSATLLKKTPAQVISFEYCESLRTPFLQNKFGWLLREVESETVSQWWLTYSLQENYRNSYFEKHFLRLLSVSRKRDVDLQNV